MKWVAPLFFAVFKVPLAISADEIGNCVYSFPACDGVGHMIYSERNYFYMCLGEKFMENRLEILRNEIDKIIFNEKSDNIRMYISHIYGVAQFCTLLAMKRNLNVELSTTCGMLHDIFYLFDGTGDNHAAKGAEQAETILKAMRLYSDDEIKIVTTAISRHCDKKHIHEPYDELLKDADVMDHCLYNTAFPIAQWETERYRNLLIEFGINDTK